MNLDRYYNNPNRLINVIDKKNIDNKINEKIKVYISLTTLPDRLSSDYFKKVIYHLILQDKKPDCIIINIPKICSNSMIDFEKRIYIIPEWLKRVTKVYINRCNNDYGPSTKIYPTLFLDFIKDNDIIICCDDDLCYDKKFIKLLYDNCIKYPNKISTLYTYHDGLFQIPNGFAGICGKKNIMNILNKEIISDFKYIDDNWYGYLFHMQNIEVVLVDNITLDYTLNNITLMPNIYIEGMNTPQLRFNQTSRDKILEKAHKNLIKYLK